jgi:hypothetical protein
VAAVCVVAFVALAVLVMATLRHVEPFGTRVQGAPAQANQQEEPAAAAEAPRETG